MTTYTFRSFNISTVANIATVYTSELEIVTNGDATNWTFQTLGTTSTGMSIINNTGPDIVQAVSTGLDPYSYKTNDLNEDTTFFATVTWGDNSEYTSTILLVGKYSDLSNDFIGTFTLLVIDGDDVDTATDSLKLLQTITNITTPAAPYLPDTDISFEDFGNLLSVTQNDTMTGGDEDNWFYGGVGDDTLYGGDGVDIIFSGSGTDFVDLGNGNDLAIAGGGQEEFHGGDGNDSISYYNSTGGVIIKLATNEVSGSWADDDTISGFENAEGSNTGNDKIYGTSGANIIWGQGGDDRVYAGKGTDKVYLGDGNDYVRVGGGQEEFYGGDGHDYISYYSSSNGVTVNLETNEVSGSWAANDTISGFESVTGSKTGNDKIYGTSGANTIKTYGGDDRVYAGKGTDKVYLGDGDDYVRVGGGREEFYGGDGHDYISYYSSSNGVTVNLGTNEVSGSWAANDTISGFESVTGSKTGNDKIYGTSGANTIKTYGGDDRVYAGKGTDKVYLGDGDDYVRVGGGKEEFYGGDGHDYISYYSSSNGIIIDLAADKVSGSWAVNDTISGFESAAGSKTGHDTMAGTSGSNTLKGFGGNDKLYGRGGDDKLYGGDGEDRFDGGAGTDLLYGGADADIFHLDHGEGHDIIKDFQDDVDTIELDNFTFAEGQDAFDFATQAGDDVVFDFGNGDMLTVENATIGQLYNDLELV